MNIKMIVSKQDLCSVEVPQETSTYKPVEHCALIDLTLDGAAKEGFNLTGEKYRASNDGRIATAYYDFQFGDDPEIGLRVAWQNSYNKQVSLKYAIGVNVFVCENGCFHGDLGAFRKKHVGEVQTVTPEKVHEYLQSAGDTYIQLGQHKEKLKTIEVDKRKAARMLGELYVTEGIMKETQVSIAKEQILKPSYNYNAGSTAWEFYNHITHALKTLHPAEYIEAHQKLHDYFVKRFIL